MPPGPPIQSSRALIAYNALLLAAGLLVLPFALVGLVVRPRWRVGLRERLGVLPGTAAGRPAVWVHGASVGEITALAPVVRMLRTDFPQYRLVVSTMTHGGRRAADTRVPDADARVLFPLDLPWAVAGALRVVGPRLVLFSETEIWPNFLNALAVRRIPAVMLSGRVSERAFWRYRKCRWLFAPALASVRCLCVQTRESARRLIALGARPERVVVTGSLKATIPVAPPGALTLEELGVADHPVLVAGSTHAGEEQAVLDAWPQVTSVAPQARLVIAPRRPERFEEVATLLARRGVAAVRRSHLRSAAVGRWPADVPVMLLDTIGELAGLYAGARAAFVGGTLVAVGGHNVLEPAAAGVPVLFGPYLEHTREAAAALLAGGGGLQVEDAVDLGRQLAGMFAEPAKAAEAGRCARAVVERREGPLVATLAIVSGILRTLADAGVEDTR